MLNNFNKKYVETPEGEEKLLHYRCIDNKLMGYYRGQELRELEEFETEQIENNKPYFKKPFE